MPVQLNPYIGFKDTARPAMEFYQTVFGGQLDVSTFGEAHMPDLQPSEENLVMHAQLTGDNGIIFMASDTPEHVGYQPGASISMSLSGDDDDLLSGYYTKLSEGGNASMPLAAAPWGDKFGMLTDKFGINWMVNIAVAKE